MVLLAVAAIMSGRRHGNDWNIAANRAQPFDELLAGNSLHFGIEHNAVYGWESREQANGFLRAVSGYYVELGCFNHELAR